MNPLIDSLHQKAKINWTFKITVEDDIKDIDLKMDTDGLGKRYSPEQRLWAAVLVLAVREIGGNNRDRREALEWFNAKKEDLYNPGGFRWVMIELGLSHLVDSLLNIIEDAIRVYEKTKDRQALKKSLPEKVKL